LNRLFDDAEVGNVQTVELGVLGPLQVREYGLPVAIPGAKPRAILTMLGLHGGSVVPADILVELLWGADPPRTAAKALQTHISALRRTLGDGFVLTEGTGWTLSTTEIDAFPLQVGRQDGPRGGRRR
jgi:DNA-binding SARP family transcriptional activator